jgi:hypothetical protein
MKAESVGEVTGTKMILRSNAMKDQENFKKAGKGIISCNKDTEGLVTMNTYSRGHIFYVSSGGFIRYWVPMYTSESMYNAGCDCNNKISISSST